MAASGTLNPSPSGAVEPCTRTSNGCCEPVEKAKQSMQNKERDSQDDCQAYLRAKEEGVQLLFREKELLLSNRHLDVTGTYEVLMNAKRKGSAGSSKSSGKRHKKHDTLKKFSIRERAHLQLLEKTAADLCEERDIILSKLDHKSHSRRAKRVVFGVSATQFNKSLPT